MFRFAQFLGPVLFTLLLLLCTNYNVQADQTDDLDSSNKYARTLGEDNLQGLYLHSFADRVQDLVDYNSTSQDRNSSNNSHQGLLPANRNDSFDGSEFNAATYIDTDFAKQQFSSLFNPSTAQKSIVDLSFKSPSITEGSTDQAGLATIASARKRRAEMDKMTFRDLVKPVYYLPGDWLPSSLDPVWNGGFTTAADNGAPVPYRLNGHVDIQRGLPWKE